VLYLDDLRGKGRVKEKRNAPHRLQNPHKKSRKIRREKGLGKKYLTKKIYTGKTKRNHRTREYFPQLEGDFTSRGGKKRGRPSKGEKYAKLITVRGEAEGQRGRLLTPFLL